MLTTYNWKREPIFAGEDIMTHRVLLGARVDPLTADLARKLAQKLYGSEKRVGYILDDAISKYHQGNINSDEAQSYLSNIEQHVIRSLEKKLEAIGRRATEVIDSHLKQVQESNRPLLVRQTRESIYTSLAIEELCVRAIPNYKDEVETNLSKEVTTRMKRKLIRDGDTEGAKFDEENANLREQIRELKKEKKYLKNRLDKIKNVQEVATQIQNEQNEINAQFDHLTQEKNKLKREKETLQAWTRGLITHMKSGYSRVKSNEKLYEEYIQANPQPEGL